MKDKKIRVELLADRLQNLLQLIDAFMTSLEEGDFELYNIEELLKGE